MTFGFAAADGIEHDRNQLIRSDRASIARLSLELRAVRYTADLAEQSQEVIDPAIGGFDLAGGREWLKTALGERVNARRAELAADLDRARDEATRIVASAQRRADQYLGVAHDAVLLALHQPGEPLPALPPLPPAVVAVEIEPNPLDVIEPPAENTAADVGAIVAALQPYLAGLTMPQPARAPVPRRPRPPLKKRLLHIDVLLPLIAVIVVAIVLLAWAG